MFGKALWAVFLWLLSLRCSSACARSVRSHTYVDLDVAFQNHTARKTDVFPEYPFSQSFEWRGPWTANEKSIVIAAAIGAMDLMSETLHVLTGKISSGLPQGEQDPSFSRYFRPGDMRRFQSTVGSQLGLLGCPGYSAQRGCLGSFLKIILYRGDGPNFPPGQGCANDRAYVNQFQESTLDGNVVTRAFISICDYFFQEYKAHVFSPVTPNVPSVDPAKMYTYIDEATPHSFEALSGAADFMHELFHIDWIYTPTLQYQIRDLYLTRPDTGEDVQGYRGYYAMKVKDPTWNPRVNKDGQDGPKVTDPLYNVDSYVMCILEIFYRTRYNRQPWIDSPDPKGSLPWR